MAVGIGRRQLLVAFGGAAVAWPLAARAQQPALPVVGFIHGGSAEGVARGVAAFRKGLNETGYVEGQNVTVEYRWLRIRAQGSSPLALGQAIACSTLGIRRITPLARWQIPRNAACRHRNISGNLIEY